LIGGRSVSYGESSKLPEEMHHVIILPVPQSGLRRWTRRGLWVAAAVAALYLLTAYAVFPLFWRHFEHMPRLEADPAKTFKSGKIAGDPVNLTLIGTRNELEASMTRAGWQPADSKSLETGLRTLESELLGRNYPNAPVSDLFLFGRRQDLAFEKVISRSLRSRHHVRFWQSPRTEDDGRPIWLGAATFDRSLGLSRRTGQMTHHIAPDVDAERDRVIADLEAAGRLARVFQVSGIGPTLWDRTGEGDWYFSDGEKSVGILAPLDAGVLVAAVHNPSPAHIRATNGIWRGLKSIVRLFNRPPARNERE